MPDHHPLVHDAHGNALDSVAQLPPHRVPRGQLCDYHLEPHAEQYQQGVAAPPSFAATLASQQRDLERLESCERAEEAAAEAAVGCSASTRGALRVAIAELGGARGKGVDASVLVAPPPRGRGGPASRRGAGRGRTRALAAHLSDAFAAPPSESDE